MQIFVDNPIVQTQIFIFLLVVALLASLRRKTSLGTLSIETTQELKGFAIIAILFAHIGYYLAADTRFLFPISVLAGVGVDLFLFLSGFGLTASALTKELSPLQFYRRRLKKIYLPLWITLALFFALDFVFLHKTYAWSYALHAFAGWFPHANLFTDLNSPLWYISLILFYYLVFPLVFSKRWPLVSAAGIYALTLVLMWWDPEPLRAMMPVYKIHFMAFPLGILAASLVQHRKKIADISSNFLYYPVVLALTIAAAYFAIYSGVGKGHWIAEGISILTMLLIIALFVIKRSEVRLFYLFGIFSFEIYLLHWPILYRYDFLFRYLPASLALALYMVFFLTLAWGLQKVTQRIDPR